MRRLLLALTLSAGCSDALPPQSRVDKLRVLAVRAEPPEVMPGQASTLDALVALPPSLDGDSVSYLWLACRQTPGTNAPDPCAIADADAGVPDGSASQVAGSVPSCDASPDARLCVIGTRAVETYTPPQSALGGASAATVIVTAIVADAKVGGAVGCALGAATNSGAPADPSGTLSAADAADHCVIALKRLTVSTSSAPNHNPTLAALLYDPSNPPLNQLGASDGGAPAGSDITDASAGYQDQPSSPPPDRSVALRAVRAAGSSEVEDADAGTREPLVVSWYASAGSFSATRTTYQPSDCPAACMAADPPTVTSTRWTPPSDDEAKKFAATQGGLVRFWAVVRDDRGGVGWLTGSATRR